MKANIKYFGMIAEKMGKTEEIYELEFSGKLNLREYFLKKDARLQDMNFQIAVNKTLTEVITNDLNSVEIALLPPFAGG